MGFPGIGKSEVMNNPDHHGTLQMQILDEPNYRKGNEEFFKAELLKLVMEKKLLLLPAHGFVSSSHHCLNNYI